MAANTSILYQHGVSAGETYDIACASHAEQHSALRAVMGAPVRAGDIGNAINIIHISINYPARLVAVGAQVKAQSSAVLLV
jgi:hypothetical protein